MDAAYMHGICYFVFKSESALSVEMIPLQIFWRENEYQKAFFAETTCDATHWIARTTTAKQSQFYGLCYYT